MKSKLKAAPASNGASSVKPRLVRFTLSARAMKMAERLTSGTNQTPEEVIRDLILRHVEHVLLEHGAGDERPIVTRTLAGVDRRQGLDAKQAGHLRKLEGVFGLNGDEVLKQKLMGCLPGQPADFTGTVEIAAVIKDDRLRGAIEKVARCYGKTADEYVGEAIGSSLNADCAELIFHLKTGEIIGDAAEFERAPTVAQQSPTPGGMLLHVELDGRPSGMVRVPRKPAERIRKLAKANDVEIADLLSGALRFYLYPGGGGGTLLDYDQRDFSPEEVLSAWPIPVIDEVPKNTPGMRTTPSETMKGGGNKPHRLDPTKPLAITIKNSSGVGIDSIEMPPYAVRLLNELLKINPGATAAEIIGECVRMGINPGIGEDKLKKAWPIAHIFRM